MSKLSIRDQVEELILSLARAKQITGLYGEDHQMTHNAAADLFKLVNDLFMEMSDITIGIVGNEIAFKKTPFFSLSKRVKSFIEQLKALGVNKINISMGLTKEELAKFLGILTVRPDSLDADSEIQTVFESKGIKHITVGDIGVGSDEPLTESKMEMLQELLVKEKDINEDFLADTYKNLKGHQAMNVDSARQIVTSLINNLLKNKDMLLLLSSMRRHDDDNFAHDVNVSVFSLLQAEVLGLEEKYLKDLGMAAMLHDIGKLSSPSGDGNVDEVPSVESTVSERENRTNQDVAGAKILLETEGISPLAAIVAFEHNINYDLTGNPMKLYGKDLNLMSMIIAISDYYDQLRSNPSYSEEGGPEKAYDDMMKLSGTKFHPDLLQNFFSVVGIYPAGTLVELDSREIALVIQASSLDIRRPQVEILYNNSGEKYDEPQIVNLIEKDKRGKYKRSIVKSLSPKE